MNTIEHYVLEVLEEPIHHVFENSECYTVKVRYNAYGVEGIGEVFCYTKQDAYNVKVGYKYLA